MFQTLLPSSKQDATIILRWLNDVFYTRRNCSGFHPYSKIVDMISDNYKMEAINPILDQITREVTRLEEQDENDYRSNSRPFESEALVWNKYLDHYIFVYAHLDAILKSSDDFIKYVIKYLKHPEIFVTVPTLAASYIKMIKNQKNVTPDALYASVRIAETAKTIVMDVYDVAWKGMDLEISKKIFKVKEKSNLPRDIDKVYNDTDVEILSTIRSDLKKILN